MLTLSVGVLATLINVITLLIVSFTDRALEFIVRNFSVIRLRLVGRAPVVHDSDVWLPNLPRSLLKYLRYPFILLTLVCSVLLVASELITELGVDTRQNCGPYRRSGPVISSGDTLDQVTDVELGASSFFLQGVGFIDGPLTEVKAGIPRKLRNVTCISCVNVSNIPVMSNCTVTNVRDVKGGDMRIGINRSLTTAFRTVTEEFKDLRRNVRYQGFGDVTKNNNVCATFLFVDNDGRGASGNGDCDTQGGRMMGTPTAAAAHLPPRQVRQHHQHQHRQQHQHQHNHQQRQQSRTTTLLNVTYLEYANQEHCEALLKKSKSALEDSSLNAVFSTTERTRDTVYISSIVCTVPSSSTTKSLTSCSLANILRGYRAIQLENTIYPALLNTSNRFAQLSEDDVYRAVLAMKIIDNGNDTGEFFEYVECGTYHVQFMGPFVVTLGVIALLGVMSRCLLKQVGDLNIPYTSNSWFAEVPSIPVAQQQQQQQQDLWWWEGGGGGNAGVPTHSFSSSSNSSRYANNNPNNTNNNNTNYNNNTHVNIITHHDPTRPHHHLDHQHDSDNSPSHTPSPPPSLVTTTAPTHTNTSRFSFSWNPLRLATTTNTRDHHSADSDAPAHPSSPRLPSPATARHRSDTATTTRRRSFFGAIRDELVLVSDGATETVYIDRHCDTSSFDPVITNANTAPTMIFTRVGAGVDIDHDHHQCGRPPPSSSSPTSHRSERFVRSNYKNSEMNLHECDNNNNDHTPSEQQQYWRRRRGAVSGDRYSNSNNNNREVDGRPGRMEMAQGATRGNQQYDTDQHRYWQYDEYYDDDEPPPPSSSLP